MAVLSFEEIQALRNLANATSEAWKIWEERSEQLAVEVQKATAGRSHEESVTIAKLVGLNETQLEAFLLPLDEA